MELTKLVIKHVLEAFDDGLDELEVELKIALRLIEELPDWQVDTALKAIFGGGKDA